jgi:hypothetical protein
MQKLRQTATTTTSSRISPLAAAVLISLAAVGSASAATTRSVGPGKIYATPCAAFNAAQDGDTIEISGGNTYSGDVCGIYRNNLVIRGVNGRPVINANGQNAMGKGTWVVDGNNITIENVEMLGARVNDRNGAALRLEGTGFTLRGSYIHDNEDGILSNPNTSSDILIETTEFSHNGNGDGQSHNLYIGNNRSLTFRYNYSHDANVGHNLKSRALTNTIAYNRFSSSGLGQPSYEIDLPNAGTSYVIGNVIEQPSANQNPNIVAYGEEGATNPAQDLYVVNNTFLNDYGSGGTFVMVGSGVTKPVLIQNNIFAGVGSVTNQGAAVLKTNYASAAPAFVNRALYDLHPTSALMIDAGSAPGNSATGLSLAPLGQYQDTASGVTRPVSGALDIGAYEAASGGTTTPAPTPTPTPTPAPSWTTCANEGSTCSFSGSQQVRYGANGTYVTKTLTGPAACNNTTFGGDPTPNVFKTCSIPATSTVSPTPAPAPTPVTWTACGNEGSTCSFSGTRQVRYGANGVYATKTFAGAAVCGNAAFGGDPVPYVVKACSYSSVTQ